MTRSSFVLIPWVLLAAIVCGIICIVIYIVGGRKNLKSGIAGTGGLPPTQQVLSPHRGGAILTFGILGLVFLCGFGIIPSIIANDKSNKAITKRMETIKN